MLGWLGSGPLPSRPSSSDAPESHALPTVPHFGALNVASKTAVCPPPPGTVTVRLSGVLWLVAPLAPVTVTVKVPVEAVADAVSVSVEVALPPAAGVTGLAENAAVTPLGNPLALSVTAELKPLRLPTVTVLVPLAPCVTLTEAGLTETEKSGGGGAPPQEGNLKEPTRVLQLNVPLALMYSCVYQNVQSSEGSIVIAL